MSVYFTDPAIEEIKRIAESVLCQRQSKEEVQPQRGNGIASKEILDEETILMIQQFQIVSHKPYLTKKEAAIYLDVSERSIGEWAARPVDQNPLPMRNAGGEPRFKRECVDEWAEREAQRRRLKLAGEN